MTNAGTQQERAAAAPTHRAGWRRLLAGWAALGAALWLLFAPLGDAQFLNYDDDRNLRDHPIVSRGLTGEGALWALTSVEFYWQPLTWFTHMADFEVFGPDAGAQHLVSLGIHAANCALLLHVLLRLTGAFWPTAWVTALFAFHPLHVEAFAWISARNEMLAAFFFLGAILAHVRHSEAPGPRRRAAVCAWLLLGLASKGTVVSLPFVLLLLDYWPLRRWPGPERASALLREKWPLFAVALGGMLLQFVSKWINGALLPATALSPGLRVSNALVNYGTYAAKTLWPTDLALPYPLRFALPPLPLVVLAAVWLAATTAAVVLLGRRRRYLVTGWFWYLITLVPVIGLVQIGHQVRADRYTYLPLVGLFVAVAWAARDLVGRRRRLAPVAAVLGVASVAACAVLARAQAGYFRDSITLFRHSLAATGDNEIAGDNLGAALEAAGRFGEARAVYEFVLAAHPGDARARAALGGLLLDAGEYADAERHLREALRIDPRMNWVRVNLALIRRDLGDLAGAHALCAEALRLRPDDVMALDMLAQVLQSERRLDEAIAAYRRALRIDPGRAGTQYRLGAALAEAGRHGEAIPPLLEALRIDPVYPHAEAALGASLLAEGRRDEAREHLQRALRLDPADEAARAALGRLDGGG